MAAYLDSGLFQDFVHVLPVNLGGSNSEVYLKADTRKSHRIQKNLFLIPDFCQTAVLAE
jgi:hypothetical protein